MTARFFTAIFFLFCSSLFSINPDTPLSQAESLYTTPLQNGVKVYLQEFPSSEQWASFRVLFRHPSWDHFVYSFESADPDWKAVEEFFHACAKKAQSGSDEDFKETHFASLSSLLNQSPPQEVAVIAVGNFTKEQMLPLIESSFSEIKLEEAEVQTTCIESKEVPSLDHSHVALRISLPFHHKPLRTQGDLKECWKTLFLQELLHQRLESCAHCFDEYWVHPHCQRVYPVCGFALVSEKETENMLAFFLWHLEMISRQGFHSDSFLDKKQQLLYQLDYLASLAAHPSPSFLASHYQDQFLLGNSCCDPRDFLRSSLESVQEIQFDELLPLLDPLMEKQKRKIHLVYPTGHHLPALTEERVDALREEICALVDLYEDNGDLDEDASSEEEEAIPVHALHYANNTRIAPFLLVSDPATSIEPFYQLPLSDKEKQIIESMFSTIAENNVVELAFHKKSLEKKGDKIEHIHPLRFAGFLLSSHRDWMRTIKKSSFKWDAFISGFSRRMREELSRDNVNQYIPGFAHQVGCSSEHVQSYIAREDFEGLVKSLL